MHEKLCSAIYEIGSALSRPLRGSLFLVGTNPTGWPCFALRATQGLRPWLLSIAAKRLLEEVGTYINSEERELGVCYGEIGFAAC